MTFILFKKEIFYLVTKQSILSLKAFLYFFNSSLTIIVSFLPLYFRDKGLTASEIGTLLSIGPFAALLVQPLTGFLSDKYKTVKKVLLVSLSGLVISSIVLFQMESFVWILLLVAIFYTFLGPIGALGDSLSQRVSGIVGVSFGSIRMWGSVGFAITSLAGGLVLEKIGISNIMFPYLTLAVGALLAAFLLTDVTVSNKPVGLHDAANLLKKPELSFFLLLIMFITIAHRTNDSFMGLYMESLGGKESLIGWAWFIGVATEALVFATSGLWFRKFHELTFIMISGVIYSIRFILMSFVTEPMMILFLQPLHGFTFGLFYTAAFQYVTKILPKHLLGTGHLLLVAVFFNVSGVISSLGGGFIFDIAGGDTLYRIMGISAILGSITLYLYKQTIKPVKEALAS